MKYIKSLELNEAKYSKGYQKLGKLGYNDQFKSRVSLSKTLGEDLGFNAKKEYSEGVGFDNTSLYDVATGDTIMANALNGDHTYDDILDAAKTWYKKNESSELNEAKGKKLVSDLYKMDAQVDYLSDADDKTKKIWKKAGINPDDDNQIILYSYVNSWPETKKLLDKSKIKYKELEDPNSAGESFIVFDVNESADINEAKKFKPGDKWSNDFDYDGMLKYALKVNHKTPLKTLQKLHDSATDVNYHTPFSGLGNAIDWITDDGVNSQEGKDFMKQFHNDIKDEMKN